MHLAADLDGNDVRPGPARQPRGPARVLCGGLNPPFMIMATPGSDIHTVPEWKPFWQHSTGWHLDLTLNDANGDHSYPDAASHLIRRRPPQREDCALAPLAPAGPSPLASCCPGGATSRCRAGLSIPAARRPAVSSAPSVPRLARCR